MKAITDEDLPFVLKALAHYAAFQVAMDRDATIYNQLLERLQCKESDAEEMVGKPEPRKQPGAESLGSVLNAAKAKASRRTKGSAK